AIWVRVIEIAPALGLYAGDGRAVEFAIVALAQTPVGEPWRPAFAERQARGLQRAFEIGGENRRQAVVAATPAQRRGRDVTGRREPSRQPARRDPRLVVFGD